MDDSALPNYHAELSDVIKNSEEQHRLNMLKLDQMNLDLDKRLEDWKLESMARNYKSKQQTTYIRAMNKLLLYELCAVTIMTGLLLAVKLITPYFTH